jgi:protein-S-isoprenylcysteine O-methyltransferase Ste14
MKKYQDWAKREYSLRQRFISLGFAYVFFVLFLPTLLMVISTRFDARYNLPKFDFGAIQIILGVLLIAGGFYLAMWSIQAQITIGRGTPLPMMPTQKLVVIAPFTCCRNPMTLGTGIGYLGIGVLLGSYSALVLVLIVIFLLLLYIKFIEEKELEARFGAEYVAYKRTTPFILPRLRRR